MEMSALSAEWPIRAKPPGITTQPLPERATKTRRLIGRASSLPSTRAGAVDSETISWPASRGPFSSIQAGSTSVPSVFLPAITTFGPWSKGRRVDMALSMVMRSRLAFT